MISNKNQIKSTNKSHINFADKTVTLIGETKNVIWCYTMVAENGMNTV